jgi:hypothetical protein
MGEDFDREFAGWLRRAGESSPPPPGIVAYYVGLFESPDGSTAYLTGSREFDPEDDGWACVEDYAPREKYFALPWKVGGPGGARRVQSRVARAVKAFLASPENRDSFLAGATAVAVGFDDGDLVRVK